jgi:hypothetical protein
MRSSLSAGLVALAVLVVAANGDAFAGPYEDQEGADFARPYPAAPGTDRPMSETAPRGVRPVPSSGPGFFSDDAAPSSRPGRGYGRFGRGRAGCGSGSCGSGQCSSGQCTSGRCSSGQCGTCPNGACRAGQCDPNCPDGQCNRRRRVPRGPRETAPSDDSLSRPAVPRPLEGASAPRIPRRLAADRSTRSNDALESPFYN